MTVLFRCKLWLLPALFISQSPAHHRVYRDARSRDRECGLSKLSGVDVLYMFILRDPIGSFSDWQRYGPSEGPQRNALVWRLLRKIKVADRIDHFYYGFRIFLLMPLPVVPKCLVLLFSLNNFCFCCHRCSLAGPNCRNRHVRRVICQNYLNGFCLDGKRCKFVQWVAFLFHVCQVAWSHLFTLAFCVELNISPIVILHFSPSLVWVYQRLTSF